MALPDTPRSLDGQPLLFGLYDNAGANAAGVLRGAFQTTVNGEQGIDLRVLPTSGKAKHGWFTLAGTTAVQMLAAGQAVSGCLIKAPSTNTGTMYIGSANTMTSDTVASTGGWPLEPGETIGWPCRNLSEVWLKGTTGDKVAFVGSSDI